MVIRMVTKRLYPASLTMRVTTVTGVLFIGGSILPGLASALIAQAPLGNIPSAGKVLGWELNMNRQYTQQMNGPGVIQRPNAAEPPVIFYEDQGRPQSPQQSPYLLNTPQYPRK